MAAEAAIGRWKAFAKKASKEKLNLMDGHDYRDFSLNMQGVKTTEILYRPSSNQKRSKFVSKTVQ
jgi:hypothetical protein